MTTKMQKFDFETYAIQQFENISKKLDNLNTVFVPREEIMLMHNNIVKAIDTLALTVNQHTAIITSLKETDDKQQGMIDSKKSVSSTFVAVMSAVGAVIGAVATIIWALIALHK